MSKFKILDNLRRSFLPITVVLALVFLRSLPITIFILTSYIFPTILDILSYIIFKEGKDLRFIYAHKSFIPNTNPLKASIIRGILEISFLPHKAFTYLVAILKTIYRMNFSKKYLLEWTTSEDVQKSFKNSFYSSYKSMWVNVLFGVLAFVYGLSVGNIIYSVLSIIWLVGPLISFYISKDIKSIKPIDKIENEDKKYLKDISKKTWNYFKNNMNEENNFLPPDNYQEDRNPKVAKRTSTTNIGLGFLSVISAYDLGYISLDETIDLINKILKTVMKLKKFKGHLYNWYNTKTLEPLYPRYISTVDNGNFIGYLYTTKQFLLEIKERNNEKNERENSVNENLINQMISSIDNIISMADFSLLYDDKKHLFSIGYDVEQSKLTNSYYDLLATEARQASLIAIAKRDISKKHWNYLSRTLTSLNKYKGLISWSGTAFEYLMPNINIKEYEGSLLDESCRFLIYSQIEYAKKLGLPFGISEAAFSLKDLNNNYQYKSFGVPWLGLKRGLSDEIVISPYSVFLSLNYIPNLAIKNLRLLEKEKMNGKYGFYESIDYTASRLKAKEKYKLVKTYMAHHQALSLIAINNLINNYVMVNRFMKNPEIEGVSILLQERMPNKAIITKEKKEKVQKIKPKDFENYIEKTYTSVNNNLNVTNTISNGTYTVFCKENGEGYSKYKDILINRFKETDDVTQGILFYIKNLRNKKIWTNTNIKNENFLNKSKVIFAPERNEFIRKDDNISINTKVIVSPDDPVEIRRLEITNEGNNEETFEITSYLEPVLSKPMQDYSHRVFNNLFLTFEKNKEDEEIENIFVKRKGRGNDENDFYLGTTLYTKHSTIGELEYEIDKEKLFDKKEELIPNMIKESKPFSKNLGLVTDPCLAMKQTIKVMPKESIILDLIMCVGQDKDIVGNLVKKYKNTNVISKTIDLAKAKVEAETVYLGIKGKDIEKYQKLLSYILLNNPLKKELNKLNNIPKRIYSQSKLWKYGISGDLPIVLVKIKDLNDIYVIEDILKAYEFYLSKNIKIDLVILNEEDNSYEQFLKHEIENTILNKQMEYLINKTGGIFIINSNQIEKEDVELFEFKSNFIIDAKLGDIKSGIEDLEEEYLNSIKNIEDDIKDKNKNNNDDNDIEGSSSNNNQIINLDTSNLKYFNEFGGFSEDGKTYTIKLQKDLKLPITWSMILANKTFGTIVTQNLGGYTWHKNSRLNRLSSWNNNPIFDIPSEVIYLKDEKSKEKWSLSNNLNKDNLDGYLNYGFGYVNFRTCKENIEHDLTIFVPRKENVKINILKLRNLEPNKRNLKLYYYIKPVLAEDEIKSNGYICLEKEGNIISIKNLYKDSFKNNYCFIAASEEIKSFTGNKDSFIGTKNLSNPEGLSKVSLDNSNGLYCDSCVCIQIDVELESFESKDIILEFGEESTLIEERNTAYKYSKLSNCLNELNEVKAYWEELLGKIQVKTPLESLNILLNGWASYQTITSRLWARSGYYQSGGAIGFRDQLQDTLGLKYINIDFMREQILIACRHQFIEGDVEHWWHEDTNRGIRTRFSDDLLWLCFVVNEYISFTGDYSILDEKVPYVMGELLPQGIDERYDVYLESEVKEDVYSHCIRAIDRSLDFGEHGLPKIGSGDWNDGLNTVGNKQKGESIWLRFLYI